MITQRAFYGLLALILATIGLGVHHTLDHPSTDDANPVKEVSATDTHTHHVFYGGVKGNPNALQLETNNTYGEPNPDAKPHRHTGADYFQHGEVTWKHVDDQHVKLSDEK